MVLQTSLLRGYLTQRLVELLRIAWMISGTKMLIEQGLRVALGGEHASLVQEIVILIFLVSRGEGLSN